MGEKNCLKGIWWRIVWEGRSEVGKTWWGRWKCLIVESIKRRGHTWLKERIISKNTRKKDGIITIKVTPKP